MNWLEIFYYCLLILLWNVSIRQAINSESSQQNYFAYYISFTVVIEFIGFYFYWVLKASNSWIYNLFFIGTLLYFSIFFFKSYNISYFRKLAIFLPAVFLVIYFSFIPDNFFSLESDFAIKGNLMLSFAFIWLSLFYFLDIIIASSGNKLSSRFTFWITLGFFIWSVMVTIRVATVKFFGNYNESLLINPEDYTYIINLITYSMYLKGILCLRHQKK